MLNFNFKEHLLLQFQVEIDVFGVFLKRESKQQQPRWGRKLQQKKSSHLALRTPQLSVFYSAQRVDKIVMHMLDVNDKEIFAAIPSECM